MEMTGNQIKKQLREKGFDTKKISVRVEYIGYGSTKISCTIKDLSVKAKEVETFLKEEFLEIRRDEHVQGEYLEGCNTYVSCEYDYDIYENAIEERLVKATEIENIMRNQDKKDYSGIQIFENEKVEILAFSKERFLRVWKKDKTDDSWYRSVSIETTYQIARALVNLDIYGHFGLIK